MFRSRFILISTALLAVSLGSMPAYAAKEKKKAKSETSELGLLMQALEKQAARLQANEKALNDQRLKLEQQQKQLVQERAQFNQLRTQVAALTGEKPPEELKPPTPGENASAAAPAPAQTAGATPPKEVGTDQKEAKEKPPEIAAIIDQGGVLLPEGKMVFTPGLEYTRSSATRVQISGFSIVPALNIGAFEITRSDRDLLMASAQVRYGITNRFEIEAKVPYVYRSDATRTRPVGVGGAVDTLSEVSGSGIGDVEFGAHYQFTDGSDDWPFLIANMRFKTATGSSPYEQPVNAGGVETELPTGSGFYAIQPSITAIYPSDPVVFYSNVGYLHNFSHDFGGTTGEINPGDSISSSFGMSFSLNDKASFSLGYSHSTVLYPTQNGQTIPGSTLLQVGSVDLGYAYSLNDWMSLNFAISAGVTEDAPDLRLTYRVPITFDLLK